MPGPLSASMIWWPGFRQVLSSPSLAPRAIIIQQWASFFEPGTPINVLFLVPRQEREIGGHERGKGGMRVFHQPSTVNDCCEGFGHKVTFLSHIDIFKNQPVSLRPGHLRLGGASFLSLGLAWESQTKLFPLFTLQITYLLSAQVPTPYLVD